MRSNDILSREEIRGLLQKAIRENDTEGFYRAFDQIIECINQDIQQRYDAQVNDLKQEMDSRALAQRGVRQLTNKERDYYQKVAECMRSKDPKQALANADLVMPKTIMNAVFDELQTRHELLSLIEFIPTTGLTEMIMNTNGYQEAVWGKLCDDIVKELVSGFETIGMAGRLCAPGSL